MIDSHCHLDQEPLFNNFYDIINRSKKVGLTKILTICTTIKGYENILKIIDLDPMIYGTFGIHPHESDKNEINKDEILKKVSISNKIIGIGETGLDFYYNFSNPDKQLISFDQHIKASIELNKPLIVHSRNAEDETFNILNKYKKEKPKILMHCYTGSLKLAEKLLKLDAFFSASGIITFKNSLKLQNTFKEIPLEKTLLETDSPFLSPEPMRGKKNEPSYIKYTYEKLAELKKITVDNLVTVTNNNFNKLFF